MHYILRDKDGNVVDADDTLAGVMEQMVYTRDGSQIFQLDDELNEVAMTEKKVTKDYSWMAMGVNSGEVAKGQERTLGKSSQGTFHIVGGIA